MQISTEQIQTLELETERNNGRCSTCHQTIKIYRYKINKIHATFLKEMAKAVVDSDKNDVDISTIGLAYSVRTQVTKMRLHGLIAHIKTADGSNTPRHWLITSKGWNFLNGKSIPSKVVVYNNQVLGHGDTTLNIYEVLGERFDPKTPLYNETLVSEPESRTYNDVRTPKKVMEVQAVYRGTRYNKKYNVGATYKLVLQRLQMGQPVVITFPEEMSYRDIAAFQKDWRAL